MPFSAPSLVAAPSSDTDAAVPDFVTPAVGLPVVDQACPEGEDSPWLLTLCGLLPSAADAPLSAPALLYCLFPRCRLSAFFFVLSALVGISCSRSQLPVSKKKAE